MTDIEHKDFLTREDASIALEALQQQLDQRFFSDQKIGETARGERDKAVLVLERHLREQVQLGDENLKQHIENQVEQLRSALVAATSLQDSRFEASKEAIVKAEIATEKRFESVNGSRELLSQQQLAQKDATAALTATFVPREVHDSKIQQLEVRMTRYGEDAREFATKGHVDATAAEWTTWRIAVDKNLNTTEGRDKGFKMTGGMILGAVGVLGGIVTILSGLFAATIWLSQPRPTSNSPQIQQNSEVLRGIEQKVERIERIPDRPVAAPTP